MQLLLLILHWKIILGFELNAELTYKTLVRCAGLVTESRASV